MWPIKIALVWKIFLHNPKYCKIALKFDNGHNALIFRIPQQITFSTIRLIAPELLSLLGSLVALIVCTAFQTDSGTESNWRQPQQTDDLNEGLQVNEQAPSTSSANAFVLFSLPCKLTD